MANMLLLKDNDKIEISPFMQKSLFLFVLLQKSSELPIYIYLNCRETSSRTRLIDVKVLVTCFRINTGTSNTPVRTSKFLFTLSSIIPVFS